MASENFDPSDINQPACGNSLLNSRPSVLTNTNLTQAEAKWKVPLLGANLPHLSLSPASWMVLSRRTLAIRSLQTFLLLFSHAYMHLMLPLLWQTMMHSLCQFVHITTTWRKWKCLEEGGRGGEFPLLISTPSFERHCWHPNCACSWCFLLVIAAFHEAGKRTSVCELIVTVSLISLYSLCNGNFILTLL